jgi:hypothetical protein
MDFLQGFVNYHTLSAFFTALVLGAMVFFMFVVTPAIFKGLEPEARGKYLSTIFPMYYRNLAGLSAIAGGFIWYRDEAYWMWSVAILFLFCDFVLRPPINRNRAGRDAGDAVAAKNFKLLHRASVLINLVQLGIVVMVFFRLAI